MAVNSDCELWPAMPPALQDIDRTLTQELNGLPILGPDALTPRETQIVENAFMGHDLQQTAQNLLVSRRTVENHRANIYRKAGLSSNHIAALANLVCHSGIIPYEEDPLLPVPRLSPGGALIIKCAALGFIGFDAAAKIGKTLPTVNTEGVKGAELPCAGQNVPRPFCGGR
jgi:DNA-binding CsgD family transcriptional regulator